MKDSPSSFLFCQDNFKQLTLICSCGQKKAWILFKTSGLIYRALENSQHNSLQLKFYKMPFTLNKINNIILFTSNLLDAHNNTLAATRPCRGVQTSFTIGCQFCPSLTLLSLHPIIIFILPISITIRWLLNVKQCKNCSLSLGTCCYKTTTNYRVITKSAAENKILRAYRPPCPPVCANWVNWPFRDQHHAAMYLDLASIFFLASKYHASYSSEINITLLCT